MIDSILSQFDSPESAVEEIKKIRPQNPVDIGLDLQVLLNALGREEESFSVSCELLEQAPKDSRVLFNHGWHLLKRGQLQKGMLCLEHGRALGTYGHLNINTSRPLWQPKTGRGQRVLLSLEGGFGDELIHVRFGQDLVEKYNCKVVILCNPQIAEFYTNLDWVSAVAQKEAAPGIYHDSWLPGMSAALALGYEFSDISGKSYLKAKPELVKQWGSLLQVSSGKNQKLKVGIRWSGNPKFEHQQLRKFSPDMLTNLRQNPNVQLYSFQRDNDLIDLPSDIVDLGPRLQSWDDTAAALMNMDLVISSCTSVAHMSAGLGKKTWVVVPALPYFVWARPGKNSVWYDSVTLFRQQRYGNWESVAEELKTELAKLTQCSSSQIETDQA